MTRFEIVNNGDDVNYRKLFIYPAYSCSPNGSTYNVTRDKDSNGALRYCVSTEIETTDSSFGKTVVNIETGSQMTISDGIHYLKASSTTMLQNASVNFDTILSNSGIQGIQGTINASNYQQYSNTQIDNYASGLNSQS